MTYLDQVCMTLPGEAKKSKRSKKQNKKKVRSVIRKGAKLDRQHISASFASRRKSSITLQVIHRPRHMSHLFSCPHLQKPLIETPSRYSALLDVHLVQTVVA